MKNLSVFLMTIVALSVLLGGADMTWAQSVFLEPNSGAGIHLEAVRPNISGTNFTNLSFAYFLSGRFRTGDNVHLRLEVPFAYYSTEYEIYYDPYYGYYESGGTSDGRSSLGNPYLGVEVGPERHGWRGEFGFRLPLVDWDSEAWDMGVVADYVERMEAHLPDYLPVYAGANYKYRSTNGLGLMIRLLPVVWIYSGDGNADTEVLLIHSAQVWYEDEKVGVGAGFSGRAAITGDADDLGERTFYQFGFFANYRFGTFMPGFQVRFPLDSDLRSLGMNPSYGISLGIAL